ncbi:MAG: spondin domain-containing protein [Gammaproteobacteria bacterium]
MKALSKRLTMAITLAATVTLYGCGDNDDPAAMRTFDVTVTNLTNSQPMSPVAVVAHNGGFSSFSVGQPASAGLELLAEGGDNSDFIAAADTSAAVFSTASGAGAIGPGGSETVSVSVPDANATDLLLTVMTMLVNTNDAFSGVSGLRVADLQPNQSDTVRGISYDAGTESNTEAASDLPGPAGNGEGFNAARDDRADAVTSHSGVVTADDGLATSGLNESHRWLNPVVQISVTRTQ